MRKIFLFLCFTGILLQASSQEVTITGRVFDEDTQEGLPFSNVYFEGTTIGISTDLDGYYTYEGIRGGDTLSASALGYETKRKIISTAASQTVNFSMSSGGGIQLDEIVVVAGENPANEVVKNIIKNKKRNNIANLSSYEVETYDKVELDLINIDEKMRKRKIFKPFEFIFENIDSTSDEKPFLPAYITETISDVYYVKGEGNKKSIPRAQRNSGVNNQTVIEFIGQMHQEFSIYDNWINILEKGFASPFSNSGLFFYEYYIMDSTYIDGKLSFNLKFKPKRKQENTFYGDFWVADSSFAIQRVNMRMSPDVNINLVSRVIIYEEFELAQDSVFLPKKQKMVIDFTPTKNTPGIIGRKSISYKNFKIDGEETKAVYKEKDPEDYNIKALEKTADYWKEARHGKLTENEEAIYTMIDSVKNVPLYKTYVDVIETVVLGYKDLGPIAIGPYFSMYSFNDIEGHRFRLGARTSLQFSEIVRFGGYAAYGLKDKRWKYQGYFRWNLKARPRMFVGGAYKDDIEFSSGNSEDISGGGNILSGFYRRNVPIKLLHVNEGKLYLEKDWKRGWNTRTTVLYRHMDPYGNLEGAGFNFKYLPDPEIPNQFDTTTTTTEFILKVRYAYKERYVDGPFDRSTLGSLYPIAELQYTAGVKGILGSQHNYHKLTVGIKHWFNINPIGWLSYRVKVGKTFGTLPYLLLQIHPGNETYFYSKNAFNGVNLYEFTSDTYATLKVEHHFDGFFLNKIPFLRKLDLRSVAHFKGIWGTLSEANRQVNRLNFSDSAGKIPLRSPDRYPYMETGFGVENILKFIRVDALWRLNYLDNEEAQRFTPRVSMYFAF